MLHSKTQWLKEHGGSLLLASGVLVLVVAAFAVMMFLDYSKTPEEVAAVRTPPTVRLRSPQTTPLPPMPGGLAPAPAPTTAPPTSGSVIEIGAVRVFTPTRKAAKRPAVTRPMSASQREALAGAEADRRIRRAFELLAQSKRGVDTVDSDYDRVLGGSADSEPSVQPKGRLLSGAELRRMQRHHRAAVQLCYQQAALEDPDVPAKVRVHVALGSGGDVRDVTVDRPLGDELGTCLARGIRAWSFPSDLRPQPVTFSVIYVPATAR